MLDSLRDNLRAAIKRVVKSSGVDEALIGELCHDVQSALLRSDVNVAQVQKVSQSLKKRALEESPPPGLSRKDHIVKILYGELAGLMGSEPEFELKPGATNKIVMLAYRAAARPPRLQSSPTTSPRRGTASLPSAPTRSGPAR